MGYIVKSFDHFNMGSLKQYLDGHLGFIAGGAFKNIFNNEKVKDLDIFFNCIGDYHDAVEYYTKSTGYTFTYSNDKVISFTNKSTGIRLELINTILGCEMDILNAFDFSITKFAFSRVGDEYFYTYSDIYFEDLSSKKLNIDNELPYPVSTYERSYRYAKYGYMLCKESRIKLIIALKSVKDDDIEKALYFSLD